VLGWKIPQTFSPCIPCRGAFKFRGACNAVFSLPDEDARKGVVTHSSGNHAGALALAARLRGIPAHIVVPSNTPKVSHSPPLPPPSKSKVSVCYGKSLSLPHPLNGGRILETQVHHQLSPHWRSHHQDVLQLSPRNFSTHMCCAVQT
jgi:hypothetical protein